MHVAKNIKISLSSETSYKPYWQEAMDTDNINQANVGKDFALACIPRQKNKERNVSYSSILSFESFVLVIFRSLAS